MACIGNIEKGLSEMWKRKACKQVIFFNALFLKNIPTAEEIYLGRVDKIWVFLKELFDVFVIHDMNILLKYIVPWADLIISRYDLQFSSNSLQNPYSGLTDDLCDGKIFLALLHFYRPNVSEEPKFCEIYRNPSTPDEIIQNLRYLFSQFRYYGLPIWYRPEEYLENIDANPDIVKLQLYFFHLKYRDKDGLQPETKHILYRGEAERDKESLVPESKGEIKIVPKGIFSKMIVKSAKVVAGENKEKNLGDIPVVTTIPERPKAPPSPLARSIDSIKEIAEKINARKQESLKKSIHQPDSPQIILQNSPRNYLDERKLLYIEDTQ